MAIGTEECMTCKKKIDQEKTVKQTVDESTFKFCSQACADAYKEETDRQKSEEIKEKDKHVLVPGWGAPV